LIVIKDSVDEPQKHSAEQRISKFMKSLFVAVLLLIEQETGLVTKCNDFWNAQMKFTQSIAGPAEIRSSDVFCF